MSEIKTLVLDERIVISVPKELITNIFRDMNEGYWDLPKRNEELFLNDVAENVKESIEDDGYWEEIFERGIYEKAYLESVE